MGENERCDTDISFSRRAVLGTVGSGVLTALAGCSSDTDPATDVTATTLTPETQSVITTEPVGPTETTRTATDSTVSERATTTASTATATPTATAAPTTAESPATRTVEAMDWPTEPVLTGAYVGSARSPSRGLAPFTNWLGGPPAVAMLFVEGLTSRPWIGQFVTTRMTPVWRAGSVPLVTWLPYTDAGEETSPDITQEIAAGEYDSFIEEWATQLRDWTMPNGRGGRKRRLYFRPAHEMNGNWFPWSATDGAGADAYVEMWRRMYEIFAQAGLDETTIQWVWAPNADEVGGVRAERYYPGDEYVDWVGLDGFNFGETQSYSSWRTPEDVFSGMLGRLRDLTDKPVALTEFASSSYRDGTYRPAAKAAWIREVFAFVADHDIRMACWFNAEKSGVDEADWAVFGGRRGTATHTVGDKTYNTYESYRTTVNAPTAVRGTVDGSPRLTERAFTGRF